MPRRLEDLRDCRLEPGARVGDDELDAAQAAPRERAREVGPERLRFARPDGDAQDLPNPVRIDSDGDYHGDGHDTAGVPDFHVRRIDPQVWPVAFERPIEERANALVDVTAQPRHLTLRDAGHAHRLNERIDGARRYALDVCFLHDGDERLLGRSPRLERGWEIAAFTKLGDAQSIAPARVSHKRSR